MPSQLSLLSLTFNVAGMEAPAVFEEVDKLEALLRPPDKDDQKPFDIYTIGLQEVHSRLDKYFLDSFVSGEDEWTHLVSHLLFDRGYVRIRSIRVLGTILSIFIHKSHLLHIREVETQYIRLSVGGYLGLKGAVAVRMKLYGISMCFVNSHLSAHDHNYESRVTEYNKIVQSLTFKTRETPNIFYHDYIIWSGDLNFRINELSFDEIKDLAAKKEYQKILSHDQLKKARTEETAFYEMEEGNLTFSPSYKYRIGTEDFDQKRKPAYTDRILHRCNSNNYEKFQLLLSQTKYQSYPDIKLSDHRPVSATFEITCFDAERKANISAYDPIIRFITPEKDWKVGEDAIVRYEIVQGESGYCSTWDWIGLFKHNFASLTDYLSYTWASSCRRSGIEKTAILPDFSITSPGQHVLIYFGVQDCVLGMSQVFNIGEREKSPIEIAEEAFENDPLVR